MLTHISHALLFWNSEKEAGTLDPLVIKIHQQQPTELADRGRRMMLSVNLSVVSQGQATDWYGDNKKFIRR